MALTQKIRFKITLPTMVLLALMVIVAIVSGYYLSDMQAKNQELTERFHETNEVMELEHSLLQIKDLFSNGSDKDATELAAKYFHHETKTLDFIAHLEEDFDVVNDKERKTLQQFRESMKHIHNEAKTALAQSPVNYARLRQIAEKHIPPLVSHLSDWHHEEAELVEAVNQGSKKTLSNYIFSMYILGSLAILTITFSMVYYHHVLTRRILSISSGTHELGDGNLRYKIQVSGDDELSSMARDINIMAEKISEYQKQLHHIALSDALTAAYNRHALDDLLHHELARAQRAGSGATALLIDVDHFKKINDRFGHDAGDKALIHITGILRQQCRTGDYVFRLGGEEFLVYLCDCEPSCALGAAERYREAIAQSAITYEGNVINLTVSIGVATSREIYDIRELIKLADRAMYQAKSQGRNCCRLHDEVLANKKKAS